MAEATVPVAPLSETELAALKATTRDVLHDWRSDLEDSDTLVAEVETMAVAARVRTALAKGEQITEPMIMPLRDWIARERDEITEMVAREDDAEWRRRLEGSAALLARLKGWESAPTEAEMIADAVGLLHDEHDRMVGLLMMAIDLVDGVQHHERRVNCAEMRSRFGREVRRSIAGANLALAQLDDPSAHVVCENCGTVADLLAEHPLDDWSLGLVNEKLTCMLCPTCKDDEGEGQPS